MPHTPISDAPIIDPEQLAPVVGFYETHPISERQVLDKLAAEGVDTRGLSEDVLQAHDQDHFGGIDANDALAARAGMDASTHVLDVCCGLGGPSRYFAHRTGCRVTGVDLTKSRIEGARRLTALTGLTDRVDFVRGNALDLPFADAGFDIAISQEAFCHVPDKDRLIAECARVLKPGGRLAFTDILATETMEPETRARLHREMTFNDLSTAAEYAARLEAAGCTVTHIDDLGPAWRDILVARLAMYRSLRAQTVDRFGQAHFEKWDSAYSHFVGHYATGQLSGGRFVAVRR